MNRLYTLFIKDILGAMHLAQEFVGGMTEEEFLSDEKTKSAVVRQLEIIGEAVNYRIVWQVLKQEIPELESKIREVYEGELGHGAKGA